MTIIPNDVVLLQNENTVVLLQGTNTIHPEIDPADEIEAENSQSQVPKRLTRERKSAIANDYIVYLQDHELDIGFEDDPTSLNEAKLSVHSTKQSNAMIEELKFMEENDV